MQLHTASEGISFAKTLEAEAATLYETMADRFPEVRDLALAHAAENKRFANNIQRVYQEVITDAIEGSYCFQLETAEYRLPAMDREAGSVGKAIRQAVAIENVMIAFYSMARDQADTLMADIPRAFGAIVRKRRQRLDGLTKLLSGAGA